MPQPPNTAPSRKVPSVRKQTTRQQRSGYVFLKRRTERAWMTGEVADEVNPWSMQNAMLGGGFLAVAVIGILAFVFSILKPSPDKGVNEIMMTQSGGGPYVMYGDVLHKAENLASARLIIGKAENPQVVKDSSLEGIPRGVDMGIPTAPSNLNAHSEDPATWTVCDERDLTASMELTTKGALDTTVIAGKNVLKEDADDLGDSKAILARSDTDPTKLWLLFGTHRAEVGATDFPAHSALGLTPARIASAQVLTSKLLNAIPALPPITVPYVADRGRISANVEGHVIGDVLTVTNPDATRDSYVVGDMGVQRIPSTVASMLINTGSRQVTVDNTESVTLLNQVQIIDVSRYPSKLPEMLSPRTVCFSWGRDRPNGSVPSMHIYYGDNLPVTDKAKAYKRPLNTPDEGVVQADHYIMEPGKGWYTYVSGFSEATRIEQLLFIEDTGTRYFIAPDENGKYEPILTALGLNWQEPMPTIWPIASLFLQGDTLSREAALMERAYTPQAPGGKPAPPVPGQVNAFEGESPEGSTPPAAEEETP